ERREFELSEVQGSRGIGRRYLMRFQRFAASAILSRKDAASFFAPGACSNRDGRAIVRRRACNSFCVKALRHVAGPREHAFLLRFPPCLTHQSSETCSITASAFSPRR